MMLLGWGEKWKWQTFSISYQKPCAPTPQVTLSPANSNSCPGAGNMSSDSIPCPSFLHMFALHFCILAPLCALITSFLQELGISFWKFPVSGRHLCGTAIVLRHLWTLLAITMCQGLSLLPEGKITGGVLICLLLTYEARNHWTLNKPRL